MDKPGDRKESKTVKRGRPEIRQKIVQTTSAEYVKPTCGSSTAAVRQNLL